jgi:hypothetical protein
MTNERIPNDPYDPYRSGLSDDFGRRQRLDTDLQIDPALQEGPSSSKVALFAVAIAIVLGAVFYGLNNTSVKDAQTSPPAQTAQQTQSTLPQAPSGMRDVTPKAKTGDNTSPGTTTGSATNHPMAAPQSLPQGTEAPSANSNDNK